jgi:hypothetical protein
MNKYQSLSDAELEMLCIKHDVTAKNVDQIVADVEVFMYVDFENEWQRIIVVDNKAAHRFSFDQEQQAIKCFVQYLTEQECIALELDCRCRNAQSSHDRKAY